MVRCNRQYALCNITSSVVNYTYWLIEDIHNVLVNWLQNMQRLRHMTTYTILCYIW